MMLLPDKTPFWGPDPSNNEEYCATLSEAKGGTFVGPLLVCVCREEGAIFDGSRDGTVTPSNLGKGPPARAGNQSFLKSPQTRTNPR